MRSGWATWSEIATMSQPDSSAARAIAEKWERGLKAVGTTNFTRRPPGPSARHGGEVDQQRLAAHVGGAVRAQPERRLGDLLGCAEPSARRGGEDHLARLRRARHEALEHRRVGGAGTD